MLCMYVCVCVCVAAIFMYFRAGIVPCYLEYSNYFRHCFSTVSEAIESHLCSIGNCVPLKAV